MLIWNNHRNLKEKRSSRRHRPCFFCSIQAFMGWLGFIVVLYIILLLHIVYVPPSSIRIAGEVSSHILEDALTVGRSVGQAGNKAKNDTTTYNDDLIDLNTLTIGVATTVTGCGDEPFVDGAAVLKYSLEMHSKAMNGGKYNYRMYILYHPNATECVLPLKDLGFTLLERPTPIKVEEIQGKDLRERIVTNGCCGEKELIKLEAYRLVQHPIIIHMDLDVLVLKPMDDVIDFFLNPSRYKRRSKVDQMYVLSKLPIMWPDKKIPDDISLIFTKDYNVVAPRRRDKPFQGGFFMLKPNLETYAEFLDIIKKGDYHVKGGWGKKVGPFHGGMTIQGLLPWYYEHLHPGKAVELNRCIYNNMNDKPKVELPDGTERCRTNEKECEDCRYTSKDDVVAFHFTICQKPWSCLRYKKQSPNFKLCREMNKEWYAFRSGLEKSWGRSGHGPGAFLQDHYLGYCNRTSVDGYLQIQMPYGQA